MATKQARKGKTEKAGPVRVSRVIWEQCFREEVCVKIPFDGKKCAALEACVRIIEEGGSYFVELQLFGHRIRHGIADVCYPVFTVAIGRLKVCTSKLVFEGGKLKSVTLTAQGCIGTRIGPIPLEKCWHLYSGTIRFSFLRSDDAREISGGNVVRGYNDIAYIELSSANDVDPAEVK